VEHQVGGGVTAVCGHAQERARLAGYGQDAIDDMVVGPQLDPVELTSDRPGVPARLAVIGPRVDSRAGHDHGVEPRPECASERLRHREGAVRAGAEIHRHDNPVERGPQRNG
jgi:hypothetical protein